MPHIIVPFMATASFIVYAFPSLAGGSFSQSSRMSSGVSTFPPLGHIQLCRKAPGQCRSASGRIPTSQGAVRLTGSRWNELNRVNKRINRSIISQTDQRTHNQLDVWSLHGRFGDCEDYALQKRQALIGKGWPSKALLVTTARDHRRRPHAVLIVKTHKGDFVLDNLNSRVKAWRNVPYQWLKQQSRNDPGKWVALSGYKEYSATKHSKTRFKSKKEAQKYLQLVLRKIKARKKNSRYARQ